MRLVILALLLAGCASKPVPALKELNNTFWLGCMNAYLDFHKDEDDNIKKGDLYCQARKARVDEIFSE